MGRQARWQAAKLDQLAEGTQAYMKRKKPRTEMQRGETRALACRAMSREAALQTATRPCKGNRRARESSRVAHCHSSIRHFATRTLSWAAGQITENVSFRIDEMLVLQRKEPGGMLAVVTVFE